MNVDMCLCCFSHEVDRLQDGVECLEVDALLAVAGIVVDVAAASLASWSVCGGGSAIKLIFLAVLAQEGVQVRGTVPAVDDGRVVRLFNQFVYRAGHQLVPNLSEFGAFGYVHLVPTVGRLKNKTQFTVYS